MKSDNAMRMENDRPTKDLRPVQGVDTGKDWRKENAKRSLERDRLSPGTRAAH